ncbi:uncharacterized protein PHACADRAFT_89055 [Phanerochaete carnosa HHB-10118-sp]|uniref:Palmitoyltransferase n=1 Tax=Phanerochaete carnosa (strain HHB-10118-sp) TaxID=650164 RepID=K5WHI4_PHACS|nr:uncharacterized protein PHACADRAFT_89055 [Phanerochaete carnosa HHB-10118-sp]EKM58574.1 hypothetical protein PHACADRAFT_89055 [Phanerochaete carnosa HHB-10118-sp]
MICAKQVFRCFKWIERAGDRLTGAAGPVFVALAVVLLSVGAACFFEVILPSLRWPWLTAPLCLLVVLNLFTHYYYVCTVLPGFVTDPPPHHGSGWLWAQPRTPMRGRQMTGVRWSEELNLTKASITRCKRCGEMRPERAHHCRICKRCVLKYDHHCPPLFATGINQCVGLHNERHFVLFLIYLTISTLCYSVLGWEHAWRALGWYNDSWNHYSPEVAFLLEYLLSVVIFFAVTVMGGFHLWGIANAETSVENQDNEHYRKVARSRGEVFINSYDLGKRKNLELYFNVGPNGYPLYTLIIPLRLEPYTDGRSWARRPGLERHPGVMHGEELTDDDEE